MPITRNFPISFVSADMLSDAPPRTETQGVYQAKYWREYRWYRKLGLAPEYCRKVASEIAQRWYNYMKVYG